MFLRKILSKLSRSKQNEQARRAAQSKLAVCQNDMRTAISEVSGLANEIAGLLQDERKSPIPEAVLLCDLDGKIIRCNLQSSELFLSDVNDLVIDQLLHFDLEPNGTTWKTLIWAAPMMEKTVAVAAIPYSGETFTAEVTMVRLADAPPNVPRILLMIRRKDDEMLRDRYRDVTDRVRDALARIQVMTEGADPLPTSRH